MLERKCDLAGELDGWDPRAEAHGQRVLLELGSEVICHARLPRAGTAGVSVKVSKPPRDAAAFLLAFRCPAFRCAGSNESAPLLRFLC